MKLRHRLAALLVALSTPLRSQSPEIDLTVKEVLENNMELRAFLEETQAGLAQMGVSASLPNPEVEYAHLWGSPAAIGGRNDFKITQEFQISDITGLKKSLFNVQKEAVSTQVALKRREIVLKTRECCIDVIYCNTLLSELRVRERQAGLMFQAEEKRVESGEGNLLDLNRVRLLLLSQRADIKRAETELSEALSELQLLNGGKPVSLECDRFPQACQIPEFDEWLATGKSSLPEMSLAKAAVRQSEKELFINRLDAFPSITAGYMSEKVVGESFRGVTLGLSIPLWSAHKNLSAAKSRYQNSLLLEELASERVSSTLITLYSHAQGVRESLLLYQEALESANSTKLIQTALELGEISIIEYLAGESQYYDLWEEVLNLKRDLSRTTVRILSTLESAEL